MEQAELHISVLMERYWSRSVSLGIVRTVSEQVAFHWGQICVLGLMLLLRSSTAATILGGSTPRLNGALAIAIELEHCEF